MDAPSSPSPEPQNPVDPATKILPSELINDEIEDEKINKGKEKKRGKRRKVKPKKKLSADEEASSSCSSSSSPSLPSSYSSSVQKSTGRVSRVGHRLRNPAVRLAAARRSSGVQKVDDLALPLGMSIAAFVNLVLEKKDAMGRNGLVDDLPVICASAVRESLANVYGNKFGSFTTNFERSFRSTLRTLRLINESSLPNERHQLAHYVGGTFSDSCKRDGSSEAELTAKETSSVTSIYERVQDSDIMGSLTQELSINEEIQQLACVPRHATLSLTKPVTSIERSLVEQTRANDLKSLEIGLTMRKLKLKETELALNYEANNLEKSKLEVGVSRASFKAEKFKTELEDTRQAELLKRCIDCLAAGLFIMLASLLYGAYVFSYHKIVEATAACMPPSKEKSSWWIPKRVASMNSGLSTLKCQAIVVSQMLFGILMILAITSLIILRASTSHQTVPITFFLLLLGILCGFAGKFCVDTLGGSGYHWLAFWETQCFVHFFSNVCTPVLFTVLYGPITVSQSTKRNVIIPYWARRVVYYAAVLFFLPVITGFIPFASFREWKDHFSLLAVELLGREGS